MERRNEEERERRSSVGVLLKTERVEDLRRRAGGVEIRQKLKGIQMLRWRVSKRDIMERAN